MTINLIYHPSLPPLASFTQNLAKIERIKRKNKIHNENEKNYLDLELLLLHMT